ncbi:HD domain-containing protein [Tatumella sp. JGM130]|uniref:HD domain-containing protein n=1 Tax=Tatumella sp. JGM130 TaxID=2799797 RepID=UPI001BB0A6D6|nr:HD domain-containing protein [Tatumella sp. JGM130]MBS0894005.1 HD domain-containing protein [Tatumella sp. JGM130]
MYYSLEEKAKCFARHMHYQSGQRRKYSNAPYIVHPQAVAELVRTTGADETLLAAAWLHDTLEDTPATFAQLQRLFGHRIAVIVHMLTNPDMAESGTRQQRITCCLQHTVRASAEAQTIKLADIIDNTKDIVDNDPVFAAIYLVEKQIQIGLLCEGNPQLRAQAELQIKFNINRLSRHPYNISASWFRQQAKKYRPFSG